MKPTILSKRPNAETDEQDIRSSALEAQMQQQSLQSVVSGHHKQNTAQVSGLQSQMVSQLEAQRSQMENLFQSQMSRLETILAKKRPF